MYLISLILSHDLEIFLQSMPVGAKVAAVATTLACGGLPPGDPAQRPRLTLAREHLLRVCGGTNPLKDGGVCPPPPYWGQVIGRAGRVAAALLRVDEKGGEPLVSPAEWRVVREAFSRWTGTVLRDRQTGRPPEWVIGLLDGIDRLQGPAKFRFASEVNARKGVVYDTEAQRRLRHREDAAEGQRFLAAHAPAVTAARAWCNAFAPEIELRPARPEAGFMIAQDTWVWATGYQLTKLGIRRDRQVKDLAQAVMDAGHTADRLTARNEELRKEHRQFQEMFRPAKGPDERLRAGRIADREIVDIVREDVRDGRDFARSAKYGRR